MNKERFLEEMRKVANNIIKYYDAEDAWETYDNFNIAIQGAWYQGLIDKATMQEAISYFTTAASEVELAEKDMPNLYGYTYRPL